MIYNNITAVISDYINVYFIQVIDQSVPLEILKYKTMYRLRYFAIL